MAKVLSIVNFAETTTINLVDDAALCVFTGESGERPLRSTDGLTTRTLNFKATASTKALARTAVNSFIAALRKALDWQNDDMLSDSFFLKEAADGETAVRSLIVDWDARATVDGSSIDAYQTENKAIYVSVALTVQDHREETAKTTLTTAVPDAEFAVGHSLILYGSSATSSSRVSLNLTSNLAGNFLKKVWIGMYPTTGDGFNFRSVWFFEYVSTLSLYATVASTTGSYGTNVVKVSDFTGTSMQRLVGFNIHDQYDALGRGPWSDEARGRFVILVRYKCEASTGTVLIRAGTAASSDDDVAFNEPRLINGDGNWHFVNCGVISFPSVGARVEGAASDRLANSYLYIDGQRLSGTDIVYFDTVTFIPYDHYMEIENFPISQLYTGVLYVNEDLRPGIYSKLVADDSFVRAGKIVSQNNFMYPVSQVTNQVDEGNQRYVRMVVAASFDGSQSYITNIAIEDVKVTQAFEAYNV